jgi:hypothetical protein
MAVDLFCYSSLKPESVRQALTMIKKQHPEFFLSKYLIGDVVDLKLNNNYYDLVVLDIANDHGMRAACSFLISLNDKREAALLSTVVEIVKSSLGEENTLILINNETRQ